MSTDSHSLIGEPLSAYRGKIAFMFWMIVLTLLPAAVLLDGMAYLMIGVAAGVSVMVWERPQEAPGAGMLYLFACNIVYPSSARFDGIARSSELVFWALGLLMITVTALVRVGVRRVFTIPVSAKIFLATAFIAAVYGLTHGAEISYVVRQFYGVLLLVVYLGISLHAGDLWLLVRRIQLFGVLCALLFYVYFLALFSDRGFHREQTTMGSQAAMMAILLLLLGWAYQKRSWIQAAAALILAPALIFQRRDVLTFLLAVPLAFAVQLKSKALKILCFMVVGVLLLPGIFPSVAESAGGWLANAPVIGSILPEGSQDPDTLLERVLQLNAAVTTIETHPWFGAGLGGNIGWTSPVDGFVEGAYIDNGWAYLFQKMGLIGAAAFLWFLISVLRNGARESWALAVCLLAVSLLTMFTEPVFFHFTTAPFLGTIAGLLLQKNYRNRRPLSSSFGAPSAIATS